MITISYKASFVRQMNKLDRDLVDEVFEKIEFFKDVKQHNLLKVHKLHGKFSRCFSFSVNYKTRIVFEYENKQSVVFLVVGDHDIYK